MQLFSFTIGSLFLVNIGHALVRCNKNATKLQLCSIDEAYDKSVSGWKSVGKPIKIWSSVHVKEIAELDENQQTITLDLILSVWWQDPRITLESNNPNEYVKLFSKADLIV